MGFHRQPVTFVSQVDLKVKNLQHSLRFYKEIIGFTILDETERFARLSADGTTTLLTLEQPEHIVPKQSRTTGLYHFALLLPKRSDLASIVQHFSHLGVQFASSDHLVSEALYLSDPDGNGIEIYTDRPSSEWNWRNSQVEMTVDPLNFTDLLSSSIPWWRGLPAQTVMGHIHLHVSELPKTEEYYTKGLGLEVVCRYGNQALFISDGKYHHHIGLNTWNGVGAPTPPPNSVGLHSFVLMLENEEKRNTIISQLKTLGATVKEEDGQVITFDPSGNRIILQIG